jgi:hypothetical protein
MFLLDAIEIRLVNPLILRDEIGVAENEFAELVWNLSLSINNDP